MQRTIKVTGKANLNVSPNQTTIRLELKNVYEEYEITLLKSNEETKDIKEIITSFGIERNNIKTKRFNIETEYTSYKDTYGDYQKKFVGYKYNHIIEFSFDNDNKLLGNILSELSHKSSVNDIRVYYTIKDKEEAKNKLLKQAVKDAINKAEIIADASNVNLGNIVTVDYSFREFDYRTSPFGREYECNEMLSPTSEEFDMDITPEDIELKDDVTVVFEIL